MPKASAPKLHQRNVALGIQSEKALRHRWVTEGLQPISSEPAPSHRPWASVPGATPKRTGVEHDISRRTRTRIATEVSAPDAEASVSTSVPRGASPRRILVSLGSSLTAVAEPTPPQRSWMSLLGVRPLADRFQTTTRRKSLARSVTFLRDPTIPISVTWLNDLTRIEYFGCNELTSIRWADLCLRAIPNVLHNLAGFAAPCIAVYTRCSIQVLRTIALGCFTSRGKISGRGANCRCSERVSGVSKTQGHEGASKAGIPGDASATCKARASGNRLWEIVFRRPGAYDASSLLFRLSSSTCAIISGISKTAEFRMASAARR